MSSERDSVLARDLGDISKRLASNTYPNGQMVWEEVFRGEDWNFDREIASIIVQTGNGFFGRSRVENISFLEKSIKDKECFSDIFNSLVDKIIVYKENSDNKKIKLDILFKTGESINTYSDNLCKKFHLLDHVTANNGSKCSYKWWNTL